MNDIEAMKNTAAVKNAVVNTDVENDAAVKAVSAMPVQCGRVSKKFYTDMDVRVHSAIEELGGGHDVYLTVRMAIDRYISAGVIPGRDALMTVRLIFTLLKPEIDKAMTRSLAARERAASRRKIKSGGPNVTVARDETDPMEMADLPTVKEAGDETAEDSTSRQNNILPDSNGVILREMIEAGGEDGSTDGSREEIMAKVLECLPPMNRRARRELQRKLRQGRMRV